MVWIRRVIKVLMNLYTFCGNLIICVHWWLLALCGWIRDITPIVQALISFYHNCISWSIFATVARRGHKTTNLESVQAKHRGTQGIHLWLDFISKFYLCGRFISYWIFWWAPKKKSPKLSGFLLLLLGAHMLLWNKTKGIHKITVKARLFVQHFSTAREF